MTTQPESYFPADYRSARHDFIAACERNGFPVWRWKGPEEPEGIGLKLVPHAQGTRRIAEPLAGRAALDVAVIVVAVDGADQRA